MDQDGDEEGWDLPPWSRNAFNLARELSVNPKLQRSSLRELASWTAAQKHLPDLPEDDLVKFLHSCGYDVKAAQTCIKCYYSSRTSSPELFTDRNVAAERLAAQLNVLDVVVLPKRTPDGCRIFFSRLKVGVPDAYVFEDHQKLMMMLMDACLSVEPSVPAFYFMYDLTMGQLAHFWKFGFWMQRKLFSYFQTGLPLLLKGVILLHTPPFVSNVMKVLSAFVNRDRLEATKMFTGDDFTPLYNLVPRDCLPCDYGGTLPSIAALHDLTVERLRSMQDYFDAEEKQARSSKKR